MGWTWEPTPWWLRLLGFGKWRRNWGWLGWEYARRHPELHRRVTPLSNTGCLPTDYSPPPTPIKETKP